VEAREFALGEYVNEVLMSLRPALKNIRHSVHVDCPDNLHVTTVPGAIAQILTNLVMNSVMHAFEPGDDGQIQISFSCEGENVRLRYNDSGKGIPSSEHGKIFEPFYTTARDRGGSGLGLNLVYNLVTATLKGTIKIDLEIEKGFGLNITFPKKLDGVGVTDHEY